MNASEAYDQAGEFHRNGKLDEAIAGYLRALELDRRLQPAWYGLACAHEAKGNHAKAIVCFRHAVSLAPDHAESQHNLGKSFFNLGLVDEALDCFQNAIGLGAGFLPRTAIATIIPGSPRADNKAILAARSHWGKTHLPAPGGRNRVQTVLSANQRIRVGYLSSFFAQDKWMNPVWGLLNHHDRERIEVHLFSDAPESQCQSLYRRHPQDHFHDISSLSNQAAARCITDNKVDLLIDLNGFSRVDRLAVMALQPAPVLAGWFNFYATSGLACYDFLIGDNQVVLPGEESYYVERIMRVPGSYLTFEMPHDAPAVTEPPIAEGRDLTFGCLGSSYKMTHPVVAAWSKILLGAPRARLFLKNSALQFEDNRQFLLQRFIQCGIDPARITMEGPAEHYEFVSAYRQVDIALDTFPYNGGTTTIEALWQGVPVLTFAGDRWAARQGASLLRAAGLPEYVGSSEEAYIRSAISLAQLASTPGLLAELRNEMRHKLGQSMVCDTRAFARNMEMLFAQMLQNS